MGSSSAIPRTLLAHITTPSSAEVLPNSDDESLMALVQAGDMQALGILFDRYSRLVFRLAARLLRNQTEAEEVVQEIFVQVYRKARRFDATKGSFRSWLVTNVYCESFNRRDYLKARRFYDSIEIGGVEDLLPSTECIESHAQTKELQAMLEHAFSRLNERQQRTLELFFFKGHSLREISGYLNEPLGNVRHHYYRGLDRLREAFKAGSFSRENGSDEGREDIDNGTQGILRTRLR